jgi:hypothetical protein
VYQYIKIEETIRIQFESTAWFNFFLTANQGILQRQIDRCLPVHQLPSELIVPKSKNDAILQNYEDNLYCLFVRIVPLTRFSKKGFSMI